jgi:hypothetical protein
MSCATHPFVLQPDYCMVCHVVTLNTQWGAAAPPNYTYPDPEQFQLVGPVISHAKVNPVPTKPIRILNTDSITHNWTLPVQEFPRHDHYPERFALEPKERMSMYAGNHHTDIFALDEEDFATSPLSGEKAKDVKHHYRMIPKGRRRPETKRRVTRQGMNFSIDKYESEKTHCKPAKRGRGRIAQKKRRATKRVEFEMVAPDPIQVDSDSDIEPPSLQN